MYSHYSYANPYAGSYHYSPTYGYDYDSPATTTSTPPPPDYITSLFRRHNLPPGNYEYHTEIVEDRGRQRERRRKSRGRSRRRKQREATHEYEIGQDRSAEEERYTEYTLPRHNSDEILVTEYIDDGFNPYRDPRVSAWVSDLPQSFRNPEVTSEATPSEHYNDYYPDPTPEPRPDPFYDYSDDSSSDLPRLIDILTPHSPSPHRHRHSSRSRSHSHSRSRSYSSSSSRSRFRSRSHSPTTLLHKLSHYTNSLPPLPPFYPPSHLTPLLHLSAIASNSVYLSARHPPTHHTPAWTIQASSTHNLLIIAIRGTADFADWRTNLDLKPTSAGKFLPGIHVHAGFLTAAKHLLRPIAESIDSLLRRRSYGRVVFTGHSAGGAIAALLAAHIAARPCAELARCLRDVKITLITFGAPPAAVEPLELPGEGLAIVNRGDIVARLDRLYVKGLLSLMATPTPGERHRHRHPELHIRHVFEREKVEWGRDGARWKIQNEMEVVGDVIVLDGEVGDVWAEWGGQGNVLDGVLWGDKGVHGMEVYLERVKILTEE